jgi:inner membrane protein involved in colicin E2 resistance
MLMPAKINPGPLASSISYFAPISLLFFFAFIFIVSTIKDIKIHPMNYFFLAAAFFAFHLLFSYTVDHINIYLAFILSSFVSVILVVSYMKLVVDKKFAMT